MAASQLSVYNMALRLLGDVRLVTLTDDVAARYALDDAWVSAPTFVLRQAPWRFALVSVTLSFGGAAGAGYSFAYAYPDNWTRTHAIYLTDGTGREFPFDLREQNAVILTNVETAPVMRFVSSAYADPTLWATEHFAETVAAYLAFLIAERVTGDPRQASRMSELFSQLLGSASHIDAEEESPWLRYQRDGSFLRASQIVMARGFWYWAVKTLELDSSMQLTTAGMGGFAYAYAFPSDFVQSQALYVAWDGQECPINIRETGVWNTDAPAWTARYLSTAAFDATQWPEVVSAAVLAYLDWQSEPEGNESAQEEQSDGAVFEKLFANALQLHSSPESDWLRFQLDGSFTQAVRLELEKGRWRFAVKTVSLSDDNNENNTTGTPISGDPNSVSDGSVSPGYTCRVLKPNDWLRTLRVYRSLVDGRMASWQDIDYRDELDALHVNYTPVVLRYLTRYGLDATRWPANFRDAILAWLQHCEAREDPKMAAVAKERLAFYQMQSKEAQNLDDERDQPRVVNTGRFVSGRYGRGGSLSDPQIAPPWWP